MSELIQHEKSENTQIKAIWSAIGILVIGIGWAIASAQGAKSDSQQANLGVANVSGDIKVLTSKVDNLNIGINDLKSYFKLTPKEQIMKQLNLNGK